MDAIYVKYNRLDFFGKAQYTEDKIDLPAIEHVKKAFRFFGTKSNVVVEVIEGFSTVYFWDSLEDFENKQISAKVFKSNWSFDTYKMPFDKLKKGIYKNLKREDK